MSIFTIYLLTILTGLKTYFLIGGILSFIVAFVCMINGSDAREAEKKKKYYALMKTLTVISSLSFLTSVLVPTTKDAMLIAGGYYATNIEGIDKLPKNVIGAVNKFIETYTEEEKK